MTTELPAQRPEGKVIQDALAADGRSVRKVAALAGMSDARWRQIVKGSMQIVQGVFNEVIAPPATLARMAFAVGVRPEQLAQAGRTDAADLLSRMEEDGISLIASRSLTMAAGGSARSSDPDEIDMIYASTTMSARQKLERIRMVLALRAQAEAEEAQAPAQQQAPAIDAEASLEQG